MDSFARPASGLILALFLLVGCGPAAVSAPVQPATPPAGEAAAACDATQAGILREADARAAPWNLRQHLDENFTDRTIAWLMPAAAYEKYIVQPDAEFFGRCDDTACYLFAAPAAIIHAAVADSLVDGKHDPAVLGKALGLPAANLEGPLHMMTLDVHDVCVRLPVDADPGVWKCTSADDKDCFQFGGYTSGGLPELMVINAPVAQARIDAVP